MSLPTVKNRKFLSLAEKLLKGKKLLGRQPATATDVVAQLNQREEELAQAVARLQEMNSENEVLKASLSQVESLKDRLRQSSELLTSLSKDRNPDETRLALNKAADITHQIMIGQAVDRHVNSFHLERLLLLTGQIASFEVRQYASIRNLGDVEFRVTSQWGEDGIIEWLCHKLPEIPRIFIEFGVENYSEANTRFLLQNRGWKGLIVDGSQSHMQSVREHEIYWKFDVSAKSLFINKDNINEAFVQSGFVGEIGILSIDVDGNDYWILKAIDVVSPWIIIVEINGVFGDIKALTIPYQADFDRLSAHHSGQYFGCSIEAVRKLCNSKGYHYIGTNSTGVNAFFIRGDIADRVVSSVMKPRTWPARHRDSRDYGGNLTYAIGLEKYDLIKDLPVVDLETDQIVRIKDLGPIYSDEFLKDFK